MHDDSNPRTEGRIKDPFRGAPPPGRWVLWHGPLAQAVLELARAGGRASAAPAELPPLPVGFPKPAGESLGSFLIEQGERRFFLSGEVQSSYVSCYLVGLT